MSDDSDLVYDGRARKRPPGANSTVIEIFDLLDEHPDGMTLEDLAAALRAGFPTDAYRAYEKTLQRARNNRRGSEGPRLPRSLPPLRLEYGTPLFKQRAERWWVAEALRKMAVHQTARKESDRWFKGERAPLVYITCEAGHGHFVEYDSKKGRAEDEARVRRAHIREAARKVLAQPRLAKDARKVIEQLMEIS